MRRLTMLLAAAFPFCGFAADLPDIDWQAVEREALEHFRSIIRIDTSSPPGNESEAARYLEAALTEAGIDSELYALEASRANIVARVRGNGSKRPLLLMGHTDVVGADRDRWSVDPFAAVTQDGYIYGLDERILTCIDLQTGNRAWKRGRYGHGQLILAEDLLLIQAESGDVALVEASPDSFRELTRFEALADRTWNHPVLAGSILLVRNDREAACFELPLLSARRE